ncbi:MAG: hypothetical protein WBO46_13115 [Caldilineaceae bacterium]
MADKRGILDYLGFMNWIDWLEGLVMAFRYDDLSPHRIALHHPADEDWWDEQEQQNGVRFWNMRDVMNLLTDYHITYFWHGYNSQEIFLHVPQRQARWAEYLLLRAGAPVIMGAVDGRNQQWANDPKHGGQMPTRWDDRETHTHTPPSWAE